MLVGTVRHETSINIEETVSMNNIFKGRIFEEVNKDTACALFEKSSNTGLSNGVIRNLLLVCVIEFGCRKRVFVPGSYSVPFCLRTEMKIVDKRRSSSLAGMFSIAPASFSDSQNFFYAFKSLLLLALSVFFISAHAKISRFRLHLCPQLPRQDSNLPTFGCFLYLLPREGPLIITFSIINANFLIFFVCNFLRTTVTRSVQMPVWENLDRGEDRFQPIKYLNLLVSSPFETWSYNKVSKKLLIQKKGKEKRGRQRKIEIDSQIKSQDFGLCACVKTKKKAV